MNGGPVGFCKPCASPLRTEIDRHFSNHESISAVARWLAEVKHPISRPTLSKHLEHGVTAKSTFVDTVRSSPTIKRVTAAEFTQAVVEAGAAKVEANPQAVSIDQALRAAQIIESKKDTGKDAMRVLVLALIGRPDTIDGEFTVLEGS